MADDDYPTAESGADILNSEEFLAGCLADSRKATGQKLYVCLHNLFEAVLPRLVARLRAEYSDHGLLEDVIQETMLRVVRAVKRKKIRASTFAEFQYFCVRTARRLVVDHYRKPAVKNTLILSPEEISEFRDIGALRVGATPEEELDAEMAERILNKLSKECQRLFKLRYLHDLTYADIAKRDACSADAVRMRMNRCHANAEAIRKKGQW
jgi:RNA polymerase sigma factor (sigma-70 family)